MIKVKPAAAPGDFDQRVKDPGLIAIREMVGKTPHKRRTSGRAFAQRTRKAVNSAGDSVEVPVTSEADLASCHFPAYWTRVLDDLMTAYDEVCAYSCFRIHPITGARTVEHVAPKSLSWDQAYEWGNYRLVCSLMNARKNNFVDVLDPFEVPNGWFELEPVGFQVRPRPDLPDDLRAMVQDTIDRLGLNDAVFLKMREEDAERLWNHDYSHNVLMKESPFVAMELKRLNCLQRP